MELFDSPDTAQYLHKPLKAMAQGVGDQILGKRLRSASRTGSWACNFHGFLREMRKINELHDVVLVVEGEKFPENRSVLYACSKTLRTLLKSRQGQAHLRRGDYRQWFIPRFADCWMGLPVWPWGLEVLRRRNNMFDSWYSQKNLCQDPSRISSCAYYEQSSCWGKSSWCYKLEQGHRTMEKANAEFWMTLVS